MTQTVLRLLTENKIVCEDDRSGIYPRKSLKTIARYLIYEQIQSGKQQNDGPRNGLASFNPTSPKRINSPLTPMTKKKQQQTKLLKRGKSIHKTAHKKCRGTLRYARDN